MLESTCRSFAIIPWHDFARRATSAFSETKRFKSLYWQARALGSAYKAEFLENAVIERRPFQALSGDRCGWLQARHHFSPADPDSGWGALRFWNDDEIAPNSGFPPHAHANMEIITYVRDGAVTHRDSLGNTGRIVVGDVQVMSAGTGIQHAEFNLEPQTTRIFQIWIEPKAGGGAPAWVTKPFPKQDRAGRFVTLASGFETDDDALPIRAEARVLGATLNRGQSLTYDSEARRFLYLVPAAGSVKVNGVQVDARDGAAIKELHQLTITALHDSELVLVDAPPLCTEKWGRLRCPRRAVWWVRDDALAMKRPSQTFDACI
jgi:quercetin 2,3-dioxygenase